jgi:predicted esterase
MTTIRQRRFARMLPLAALPLAVACGSAGAPTPVAEDAPPSAPAAPPAAAPPAMSSDAPSAIDAGSVAPASRVGRCGSPVPNGATTAPALPVYAATCPAIAAAPALTSFSSGGSTRRFMVIRPQTLAPGEKLPLVFVWHWLGGEPADVLEKLDLQQAVDARRFIAVAPEAKGDILFRWPFGVSQSDGRLGEELGFFDDMLACVSLALPVDKDCVSTMGVSAGALFTVQLAAARSERLASFMSISGGSGGLARDWVPAARKLPALVLWGGPSDMYPANLPLEHFDDASHALETALDADGHFILECTHNCGHALPPFDPPPPGATPLDFLWSFALDHPYWLPKGASPYQTSSPPGMPSWCGLGKGAATPRPSGAACE